MNKKFGILIALGIIAEAVLLWSATREEQENIIRLAKFFALTAGMFSPAIIFALVFSGGFDRLLSYAGKFFNYSRKQLRKIHLDIVWLNE